MLSALLGFSVVLAAYGPGPADAAADMTVWWRTQGAEVIEHRTDTGARACSLVLRRADDVLLFMWPQNGSPSLFVRHPGWRFGDQESTTNIEIAVSAGNAAAQASGVSTELPARDYRDWIRTPLDQPLADVLPTEGEIRIGFPGGQFSPLSFPIDRSRMPAVMRGVQNCKTALGMAG
jgi:hypothetical protein